MTQIRDFRKVGDAVGIPDLAELQVGAFRRFLQPDRLPEEREPMGLEALFREFFPVEGPGGALRMEYLGYELGAPSREQEECLDLGLTYGRPLRVRLRIVGPETVEEDVYLGEMPAIVGKGHFIVNGTPRVIVAQIQRSPGVDFSEAADESGRKTQSCRFVPERGTWIEFSISRRDVLQVRLGHSGKMPATWLIRAMLPQASSNADILALFYEREEVHLGDRPDSRRLVGRYLAGDIVNSDTGEVLAQAGEQIGPQLAAALVQSQLKTVSVLKDVEDLLILRTIQADPCRDHQEALLRIYARFRPGEPAAPERAARFFADRFADPRQYSLGRVGRFRINRKLGQDVPPDRMTLCPEDILNAIRYILRLRKGEGGPDDIDDLGNRILRPMDKLLEEYLRYGFVAWRRTIRERLVPEQGRTPSPRAVAASRAVANAIEEFFARSELSQVLDQTNALAELNHLRRISALGPGGLNRKRAGFEVRDVHASHYGRICPIETPEGPNIGLIASLGLFARVDEFGFITTPYRSASGNGGQVRHLRADEEKPLRLAPAAPQAENGLVLARQGEEFRAFPADQVDLMDVSPKQMVGVSAALIPFLEHDDANRALMGSNMQRQALAPLRTELPLVGTGIEGLVAASSSTVVTARAAGTVTEVDSRHIKIDDQVYHLRKFVRLSENICLNQRPVVREGDRVEAGQIIADGAATCRGELSLGRNVLAAFMIWDGYNFEDAVIVSQGLIEADAYTTIHIEEFTAELRETRLGREEFTRDIPNVSDRMLANLDQNGFVRVGTKVRPGDILVGKVAPKSKTELTPEERLLREIFGKAGIDVSNESLTVPPGTTGIVVDVRHFRRKSHLTAKERAEVAREAKKVAAEYDGSIADLFGSMIGKLRELCGETAALPHLPPNPTVRELLHLEAGFRLDLQSVPEPVREAAKQVYREHRERLDALKAKRDNLLRKLRNGDDLPPGVFEMVKVYVAVKRPLSEGDKVAGRHGNKGVIARIVPKEDMPFLADGTPVEIILNPLGVPSRMNLGQILETHLGWAARALGFRAISPAFDGATEEEIRACLREAGLPEDGKTVLYDGRTGEPFDQKVTVGYIYIMKLNHLVEDKIHARSTGPYSLITQQPLGGKARMGGQRLGEMEVWALEAYGSAFLLQEMLTVKSDAVESRSRMYESIIKGVNLLEAGMPLSFDVLVQEVRGLGLNLRLLRGDRPELRRAGPGSASWKSPRLVATAEGR